MIRIILSVICVACTSGTALAWAKPESLEEQSYNGNIVFNEELDGKAFLNRRLIMRVERVSNCVSRVWTRSSGPGSPLRRDLLKWDKMFDGIPQSDTRFYYLTFVYADHRREDVVSIPLTEHPERFDTTGSLTLLSCQPKQRHHR